MELVQHNFEFECYESSNELSPADASLLQQARDITQSAYAPYSHFKVGAAIKLNNGKIIKGSNQENASFPLGLCAERVALATVASLYPGQFIDTIAVSYHNENGKSDTPVSPCGICRQALCEYENAQQQFIKIILSGLSGKVYIIPRAQLLLPLSFSANDML